MLTIYHFDNRRVWTGESLVISNTDGAPPGWTFNAPPSVPQGKFAFFVGPDWIIIDEYPPELVRPVQVQAGPITEPVVI
jgi:hypothetical protein